MPDFDPAFVQRVLNVFQFDNTDDLWWRTDNGVTRFFVKCSDTFAYACADLEEITPENIDLLEQSFADTKAASPKFGHCYGSTLFVARFRKQKPMDVWMKLVLNSETDTALQSLFDAIEGVKP